jgi:CBS domain-containing protein
MLEDSKLTAADIMTRDVCTVFPHTSLRYVARLLSDRRISGVPVVDEDGHVMGMVTENDLLRWSDKPGEKQAWWLDMLAEGFDLAPGFLDVVQSEHDKVRSAMSTEVAFVTEDAAVSDIARLIIASAVKRVPVLRDGRLVGIVSRGDLVRAMAQS